MEVTTRRLGWSSVLHGDSGNALTWPSTPPYVQLLQSVQLVQSVQVQNVQLALFAQSVPAVQPHQSRVECPLWQAGEVVLNFLSCATIGIVNVFYIG